MSFNDRETYYVFLELVKKKANFERCPTCGKSGKVGCKRCGKEMRHTIMSWITYHKPQFGKWKYNQDGRPYTISDKAFLSGYCSEECRTGYYVGKVKL